MRTYSLILLFFSTIFWAQKPTEIDTYTPTSPETYQFKKRFTDNINYYTGQPEITIPIYEIELDDLVIPISISYNTGGIKVEEESTVVGLGWMLNYGGEINRNNHGAPDERSLLLTDYNDVENGIGHLKNEIPKNYSGSNIYGTGGMLEWQTRRVTYKNAILQTDPFLLTQFATDLRPDEFYYSFLGYSGKFMYSQQFNKFITFPLEDLRISYNLTNETYNKKISAFNITTPNGYLVRFGGILNNHDARRRVNKLTASFDQAWLITQITSPNFKNVVFNYEKITYGQCDPIYEKYYAFQTSFIECCGGCVPEIPSVFSVGNCEHYIEDDLVSEILFSNGKVKFFYGDRTDLKSGAKKLNEIIVYDLNDKIIKKVVFNHSYFTATSNFTEINSTQQHKNQRLRLNSIEIFGSNLNESPEKFEFDYYLFDKIPSTSSKGKDHWGYFNGKINNSLIPKPIYSYIGNEIYGGDRNVDTLYTKTFSLKSVKYPEGGSKEFEYENHRCQINSLTSNLYQKITDENSTIVSYGAGISGYALNYYVPEPIIPNPSIPYEKVSYGEPFEIVQGDSNLNGLVDNITLSSTLPFAVPNYQSLDAENNNVEFNLEKFDTTTNSWVFSQYLGKISKNQNNSGNISMRYLPQPGSYRFKIILRQFYSLSPPYDYNHPHGSFANIKVKKISDDYNDEITVGGLRIKKIKTYENINSTENFYQTKYEYLNEDGKSSGKLANLPFYMSIVNQSYYTNICDNFGYNPCNIVLGQAGKKRFGYEVSSNSQLPLYKTSGSNVGYTKITEIKVSTEEELKTERFFNFADTYLSELPENDYFRNHEPRDWHRGKLIKEKIFKENNISLEIEYTYNGMELDTDKGYVEEINTDLIDFHDLLDDDAIFYCNKINKMYAIGDLNSILNPQIYVHNIYHVDHYDSGIIYGPGRKIAYFKIYTGFDKPSSKKTKSYFQGNILEEKTEYFYNNVPQYNQLTEVIEYNSNNKNVKQKFYYPQDLLSQPFMSELVSQNRVGERVITETFNISDNTEVKTETHKKVYNTFYSHYQLSQGPTPPYYYITNPLYKVSEEYYKKGEGEITLSDRIVSYKRDNFFGSVTEITKENGIPTSIIWGYGNKYPIAKIDNLSYNSIPYSIISNLVTKCSQDNDNCSEPTCKEQILRTALNSLRTSYPNAMITTYTYNPLVGITSITDPKGYTTTYHYDSFNRLKKVIDMEGNILSENEYHYRTQN